jgi:hypothetical protein
MTDMNRIASQIGGGLLANNNTHENRMEIRSASSNRVYIVAQSKSTGEWQCSCPGWIMKKNGKERTCKHLQAILPMLGAAPRLRVAPPAEELSTTKAPAAKAAPAKAAPAAKAAPDLLAEIRACLVAMDEHKVTMHNKPASLQELVRLAKLLTK